MRDAQGIVARHGELTVFVHGLNAVLCILGAVVFFVRFPVIKDDGSIDLCQALDFTKRNAAEDFTVLPKAKGVILYKSKGVVVAV